MTRRVISLWLPRFATDRPTRPGRPCAGWREQPFALAAEAAGTLRLHAVNGAAEAVGVFPAMPLADARAVFPALKVTEADPDGDAAALETLAQWATRYTPWTAVEGIAPGGGAGLWLDVTGCAHLFGGEAALARDLRDRLTGFGFAVRLGLADTQGAAWAAARFLAAEDGGDGDEGDGAGLALLPEGAQRQLLMGLPVEALRLPAAVVETLKRLGIRRIADLAALPRAPLAARLGAEAARRLDQALGRAPEPFTPRAPVTPWRERLAFAEPIGRTEDVQTAIAALCRALHPRLERERKGARRLLLEMFRVDGEVIRRMVGTSRPVRDADALARLFKETLDGLDAGFGIEAMVLSLPAVDPLEATQTGFTRGAGEAPDAAERAARTALLLDRLRTRLGEDGVLRPVPRESHIPEASVTVAERTPGGTAPDTWAAAAPRPVRLIAAEPVEPLAEGTPPAAFRWRRRTWTVARSEGPERVAPEWWHGPLPHPRAARDYWRVEDTGGHRLWLFRGRAARWFVQGVFP